MKKKRVLIASVTVLSIVLIIWAVILYQVFAIKSKESYYGSSYDMRAPDFTLTNQDGEKVTLGDFKGKAVFMFFGYTHCPDICPVTLANLNGAINELGNDKDKVQVIFVTVDPERDDAARMREYLAKFDPTFVGGTGTPAELASVRERYGVAAQATGVGDAASIAHSSFTFLIDRAGALRALMPYGHPADDYADDVRILLGR